MSVITTCYNFNDPPLCYPYTIAANPVFSTDVGMKGLTYYNVTIPIVFSTENYGYAYFEFTYTGVSEYAALSFSNFGQSPIAVSQTGIEGPFFPMPAGYWNGYEITLKSGEVKKVYIIVNHDPDKVKITSDNPLNIDIAIGVHSGDSLSDPNQVCIKYECDLMSLYQYEVGVHAYSDYDSLINPKCTVILAAETPIETWGKGTYLWVGSNFAFPAPPYYYGSGDTVYKVAPIDLNRSWGKKLSSLTVKTNGWKKLWKKPPRVSYQWEGPKSWYNIDDTVQACIMVMWPQSGFISHTINISLLTQPTKYKFLMGYHANSKQVSNDNFFAKWIFSDEKFYPLTGYRHLTTFLMGGYVRSTTRTVNVDVEFSVILDKATLISVGGSLAAYALWTGLRYAVFLAKAATAFPALGPTASASYYFCIHSFALGPWGILIAAAILIGIALFKTIKSVYQQMCKVLLYEYSTGPYIELGSSISRLQDMSQINNGYYCDGVYFYTQSNTVNNKELSSTNTLIAEIPNIVTQFEYSLQADNPTLIDYSTVGNLYLIKLLLLSYESGEPIEYASGTIYCSDAINETIDISDCGELTIPYSIDINMPACFAKSRISQEDANNRAIEASGYIALVTQAEAEVQGLADDDLGELDCFFTHQIRVETNAIGISCYYNNTDRQGLTIGKKLHFNDWGRTTALTGFYAITGETPYRTFYKIDSSGYVDDIFTMQLSSSTTVYGTKSNLSVDTTNLQYVSNWYLTSPNFLLLSDEITSILEKKCLDPNTLLSNNLLVRGYYYSGSTDDLLLYDDNYNNYNMSQGIAGYYYPLIEWMLELMFQYFPSMTIYIDISQICLPAGSFVSSKYGFYIKGRINGNETSLYNEVNLTINVYVDSILKHAYNVTTNWNVKTYVPYDGYILITDNITSIQITSINSANPMNKITYVIGTFTGCSNPTTTTTTTTAGTTTTTTTFSGITTTTTTTTNPFTNGLEACWNFEEASLPLLDSTINNNDLSFNVNVSYQQTGKINYCIYLPNSIAAISSFPSSDTLGLTTFTISTWVKCTVKPYHSGDKARTIFSKLSKQGGNDSGGYSLIVNPAFGGVVLLVMDCSGQTHSNSTESTAVNDGDWHHIVATFEPTGFLNEGYVKIYHNNVLEVDQAISTFVLPFTYGSTYVPAMVGNMYHGGYSYPLDGYVDATSIWNRVLTVSDVEYLWNSGNGFECPS